MSPRLGHVRSATALATDLLGNEIHEFTRLGPGRQVCCDPRNQAHLSFTDRREQDDRGAKLVLELVDRFTQGRNIGAIKHCRQYLRTLDLDRLSGEIVSLAGCQLALETRNFLLERADVVNYLAHTGKQLVGLGLEGSSDRIEQILLVLHQRQRIPARHRFDPADACGHAALGGYPEEADIASSGNMGTAAQLLGTTNRQYPHLVSVLFPE